MINLFFYLLVGFILLGVLLSEGFFEENGVFANKNVWADTIEKTVFIWAWPAFMVVILMFPLCRDENDPVQPRL